MNIEKAGKKEKQKLKEAYAKAKIDMEALKEKLQKKNLEFENDMKGFDNNVTEKNQSFNGNSNTIWMNLENPCKTFLEIM